MPLVPDPKDCSESVKQAIRGLSKKLGYTGSPTFVGLTVQDIVANSLTIINADEDIIFYVDDDEMYFTASAAVPIAAGVVMGPWLFWFTYASP